MAPKIDFGGTVTDPVAGSNTDAEELLKEAMSRLRQNQPKAALDRIHDAVFEITETHGLNVPF
jgi:N-methylhydantoinase A/oxoprolinase/acetone carboxylase beta subunit